MTDERPFAVYPEHHPEWGRRTKTRRGAEVAAFWIGLKLLFTQPFAGERVCITWPLSDEERDKILSEMDEGA